MSTVRPRRRLAFAATLALLAGLQAAARPAAAAEVRRSIEATPRGRVEIGLFDGSIAIEGWDRNELQVIARLSRGDDGLELERSGNGIEVEVDSNHPGQSRADLAIKVPRGSSLSVSVMSASVEVNGVEGDIDIDAVAGGIRIDGRPRKVEAQTVTGAIFIRSDSSESFDLETVSGSIEAQGEVRRVDANTVAGPLRLRLAGITSGRLETVSGTIDGSFEPGPHARFDIDSFSGSLIVQVPPRLAARYELETTSGRIRSDLGAESERRGEGRRVIDTSGGLADANFKIHTFSGSIELRPLAAPKP